MLECYPFDFRILLRPHIREFRSRQDPIFSGAFNWEQLSDPQRVSSLDGERELGRIPSKRLVRSECTCEGAHSPSRREEGECGCCTRTHVFREFRSAATSPGCIVGLHIACRRMHARLYRACCQHVRAIRRSARAVYADVRFISRLCSVPGCRVAWCARDDRVRRRNQRLRR